jgi:alpha-glucosidase (family GH31 glycosyl hydrolase)
MVRFHQGDHRFWLRDTQTQDSARAYLNMRYRMAPSLIAAGRVAQLAGFPLTARCDMIWANHPEANDPTQCAPPPFFFDFF